MSCGLCFVVVVVAVSVAVAVVVDVGVAVPVAVHVAAGVGVVGRVVGVVGVVVVFRRWSQLTLGPLRVSAAGSPSRLGLSVECHVRPFL